MSLKLGLGMIVKDEVEHLDAILTNYKKYFDEIQITITSPDRKDDLMAVCSKHGAIPSYFEWVNDFAAARNYNKSLFKDCKIYFTLDCDDMILLPENIRPIAEKALAQNMSIVYLPYEYSCDEFGNVNAQHYKERFIKLDDNLYWNKKIHENVLPHSTANYKVVVDETMRVKHLKKPEDFEKSSQRNIQYLLDEYKQDGKDTDPRTLAYLGRMLFAAGQHDQARFFLEKHIEKSGWDEDRFYSWCILAEIFRHKEDYQQAIACAFEALAERSDYPDAYLKLHDIYQEQGKWEKAIEWGTMGLSKPTPKTFLLVDPSSYTWRPALSMAFCYLQIGDIEKAKKLFDYAAKLAPDLPYIKSQAEMYEKADTYRKFMERLLWLFSFIKDRDKDSAKKIGQILNSLPAELNDYDGIIALRNQYLPSSEWGDKSVVIFCGNTIQEWSPKAVSEGIGGSEEAIIYQAQELTKLGYKVTVFNTCGDDEGTYDGVDYVNFYKFNRRDNFNIFISWRSNIFPYGINAKKKIVWMHDVPQSQFKTKADVDCLDKILVLSEYHKSLLPDFAQEKAFVTSNGINLEDVTGIVRNHKRIIYASSYERGLQQLLTIWPEVMKEVPDAELHVYYGWNTYDKMMARGLVDGSLKQIINPMLNQPGVTHHGRVGHKELAQAFAASGAWAYPTAFPEISCITAMKAQAYGAIPLATDFAALKETVKAGCLLPGKITDEGNLDNFKELITDYLGQKEADVVEMREDCKEVGKLCTWANVAKEWSEVIFPSIADRTFIKDRFDWIRDKCGKDDKIVDIGGNDGHTFDKWKRDNVTTVDIDLYEIPNFVRANAENLPFADKTFDTAVLAEILEHVENPVQALKEAKRVAKKVIITVPEEHEWAEHLDPMSSVSDKEKNSGKDRELLAKEGNPKCKEFYKDDNLEHLWHRRHYTKESLAADLTKAGFENFTIEKLVLGEWVFYGAVLNG